MTDAIVPGVLELSHDKFGPTSVFLSDDRQVLPVARFVTKITDNQILCNLSKPLSGYTWVVISKSLPGLVVCGICETYFFGTDPSGRLDGQDLGGCQGIRSWAAACVAENYYLHGIRDSEDDEDVNDVK